MGENTKVRDERRTIASRRHFLAVAGSASVAGLAGCSTENGGSGSGNDSTMSTTTGTTMSGPPAKPDSITVRAWGGSWQDTLEQQVAQPFTEETGIDVTFDNTSEEQMQGKIRTAVEQGRAPPVDVNWSTTLLTYKSFQQGLMVPLDPGHVTHLNALLPAAKPDSGDAAWPFVSLYSYVYTLSYNTNTVSTPPSSWEAWWNSEWQNELGLYQNGTGFNPVVAKLAGEELDGEMSATWDRYRELAPNVGLIGDDTQLTQNLRSGEISMCVLIVSNTYNAKKSGAPVDYTVPDEGAVAKRDAMWLPKNNDDSHTYWGEEFINYACNAEYLGPWASNLGVAPLNPNAEVPEFMAEAEAYPTTAEQFDSMITVDPANYVQNSSYWFSQFSQIMTT